VIETEARRVGHEAPSAVALDLPWSARLPYPVRSVVRRWHELIGMMLGVGIALGIVMTLSGIGKAVFEIYTIDFEQSGTDLYVITQGGTLLPNLPTDTPGTIRDARSRLGQIRSLPTVNAAVGVTSGTMERDTGGPRHSDEPKELIGTMGVDGDPTLIPAMLLLQEGRWIRRTNEVVLGSKLAHEKHLGLGDTLRLNDRDFTVVGIGRLRGFGWGLDSIAYVDGPAFRQRVDLGDVVNTIAVDAGDPAVVAGRIREIESLTVWSAPALVKEAEKVLGSRLVTYYILDGLALAIGALFVSTMLNHSVQERRLEFATLRAIGLPSSLILFSVGAEAAAVSLAAGAFGVALSLLLGAAINGLLAPAYQLEFLYSADTVLFLQSFLLALGLGLISGLWPARAATRIDPAEVLREA
jgi:putative ABC transport system permease protein